MKPTPANARRPQCTHMVMNRVHGNFPCHMCGKIPEIGWLYVCQQDKMPGVKDPLPDIDVLPVFPDCTDFIETAARLAEHLQMSPSIVGGIRAGNYNSDQIHRLLNQRRKTILTIINAKTLSGMKTSLPLPRTIQSRSNHENVIASVGNDLAKVSQDSYKSTPPTDSTEVPRGTSVEDFAKVPSTKSNKFKRKSKHGCNYQVCHACRPFFKDRLHTSFESVLAGQVLPLTEGETERLPIMDPKMALTIGLRRPPMPLLPSAHLNEDAGITIQDLDDEDDEISVGWTPTTIGESVGDLSRPEPRDQYPCPGAGICPVWSHHSGCAYDSDFDDGKKAFNHGFVVDGGYQHVAPAIPRYPLYQRDGGSTGTPGRASSTAASISLPTLVTAPVDSMNPINAGHDVFSVKKAGKVGKAKTVCGDIGHSQRSRPSSLHGKDSKTSMGSEVEVEGGVALTEEAVGTGVPDIITSE